MAARARLFVLCVVFAATALVVPAGARSAELAHGPLHHRVVGYLPYWEVDNDDYLARLQWDLLSDLVYFAIEVDRDGDIYQAHGWPGERSEELIAAAELSGTRLVLGVVAADHDDDDIDAIVTDPARRTAVVSSIQRSSFSLTVPMSYGKRSPPNPRAPPVMSRSVVARINTIAANPSVITS